MAVKRQGICRSLRTFATLVGLQLIPMAGEASAVDSPSVADEDRPNIVIFIADDLGYSDIGPYGSEIATPNLDELARMGVTATNFHVHTNCSPSRAMLFSGIESHISGLGTMQGYQTFNQQDAKGYEGYLNDNVRTFATLLRKSGYSTYMTGKWHLGLSSNYLPSKRGFETTYILAEGSADHFDPARGSLSIIPTPNYFRNGARVTPTADGFYSTHFYTDRMVEMLDQHEEGKPFLAVLSFTAPHWPLQAPKHIIQKYEHEYDNGYEAVSAARLERQLELGVLGARPAPSGATAIWPTWSSLTDDQRRAEVRRMQTYAAMVEAMDAGIGYVMDELQESGRYENTVFMFLSDNGPEGNNPLDLRDNRRWVPQNFNLSVENIGSPGSYSFYGPGWARVSATPFKLYKGFPYEGGVRVPFIVSGPGIRKGVLFDQFTSVLDIAPTLYEIAGIQYEETAKTLGLPKLDGDSLLKGLSAGATLQRRRDYFAWELWDRRALYKNGWKIVSVNKPWGKGTVRWELFNLREDPTETTDLASKETEKLRSMLSVWRNYEQDYGLIRPEDLDLKYTNSLDYYKYEAPVLEDSK